MAELQGQTIGQRVEERARAEAIELGRAEDVELGIEIGQRKLLRTALASRFVVPPPLPGWVEERLAVATPEDIVRWTTRPLVEGTVTLEPLFLS